MNIAQLSAMTGHKSISDMTEAELYAHLAAVRQSRLVSKQMDKRMSEKEPKPARRASASTAKPRVAKKLPDVAALSPEEAAKLLASLLGAQS